MKKDWLQKSHVFCFDCFEVMMIDHVWMVWKSIAFQCMSYQHPCHQKEVSKYYVLFKQSFCEVLTVTSFGGNKFSGLFSKGGQSHVLVKSPESEQKSLFWLEYYQNLQLSLLHSTFLLLISWVAKPSASAFCLGYTHVLVPLLSIWLWMDRWSTLCFD